MIRDDDFACLDGRPRLLLMRLVNILVMRKMDTFLGRYPSLPFSSLYPSLNLKVMAPLCIPCLTCSNNQPIHQWDIHHHHRAEGFRVRARLRGVGIDAMDYWSLGRFRGFGKLYAWFCRRLTDADMRLQTSLSRRRSSITVHPQFTVCASVRSGYERCGIHPPKEVTKLEELVPRVCELGDGWGSEWALVANAPCHTYFGLQFFALSSLSTLIPHQPQFESSTRVRCKFSTTTYSSILHNDFLPFSATTSRHPFSTTTFRRSSQ